MPQWGPSGKRSLELPASRETWAGVRTSPQQATCLEETTLLWRQLSGNAVLLKYNTRHIDGIF